MRKYLIAFMWALFLLAITSCRSVVTESIIINVSTTSYVSKPLCLYETNNINYINHNYFYDTCNKHQIGDKIEFISIKP